MKVDLLRHLGNMEQICGIRETQLCRGFGAGVRVAEFYNAAGLRFSVTPDRCMDLYDFSYKGINLSFLSCNGLRSPMSYTVQQGEFPWQWSGGILSTCGLDNVGSHCDDGITYPTHGRISATPAKRFGVQAQWAEEDYILRAEGEMEQTRLYGVRMCLQRSIQTTLYGKSIQIHDRLTNGDAEDAPYFLLYHCNFGYPLLDSCAKVLMSEALVEPLNAISDDPAHMLPPIDGRGEELYLCHARGTRGIALLHNPSLELACYVAFDTAVLPRFLEWKMMKSHDYVLAFEPCNTWGLSRVQAIQSGKAAILPAYSSVETRLEIGVLDGAQEIRAFIGENDLREAFL